MTRNLSIPSHAWALILTFLVSAPAAAQDAASLSDAFDDGVLTGWTVSDPTGRGEAEEASRPGFLRLFAPSVPTLSGFQDGLVTTRTVDGDFRLEIRLDLAGPPPADGVLCLFLGNEPQDRFESGIQIHYQPAGVEVTHYDWIGGRFAQNAFLTSPALRIGIRFEWIHPRFQAWFQADAGEWHPLAWFTNNGLGDRLLFGLRKRADGTRVWVDELRAEPFPSPLPSSLPLEEGRPYDPWLDYAGQEETYFPGGGSRVKTPALDGRSWMTFTGLRPGAIYLLRFLFRQDRQGSAQDRLETWVDGLPVGIETNDFSREVNSDPFADGGTGDGRFRSRVYRFRPLAETIQVEHRAYHLSPANAAHWIAVSATFDRAPTASIAPPADIVAPLLVEARLTPRVLERSSRGKAVRATLRPTSGAAPGTVTLDGSGSSSPRGEPLSYRWTVIGPDGSSVPVAPEARPALLLEPGEYLVRLVVSDSAGDSDPDEAHFRVYSIGLREAARGPITLAGIPAESIDLQTNGPTPFLRARFPRAALLALLPPGATEIPLEGTVSGRVAIRITPARRH